MPEDVDIEQLKAAAADLYEACLNTKGLFDTPLERRRRRNDTYYADAMKQLNVALEKAQGVR